MLPDLSKTWWGPVPMSLYVQAPLQYLLVKYHNKWIIIVVPDNKMSRTKVVAYVYSCAFKLYIGRGLYEVK